MKGKPTVSLCMIVKNEAGTITTCINSVKHLVDEIIVVDTGSVDQTVKLAIAAGAKVIDFVWTGDFARARNFALEHATSDWIMVLDADEVLEPVNMANFNRLLCNQGVEGYFLNIKNFLGTGREVTWDQVVRLFRNNPLYRFTGAIHEQVAPSILKANGGAGLETAPLVINHYGYLNARILEKDKFNRNTLIINRELKKRPNNPFLLYCLALEYYQRDEVGRGLDYLEKALVLMRGTEGYFEDVLFYIKLGLLKLAKFNKLINFVNNCLKMYPEKPDLYLFRGLGYWGTGKYLDAARDLEKVLQTGGSGVLQDFRILCLVGDAYNLSGNYVKAEKAYLAALHQSCRFTYPLVQVLDLLYKGKSTAGLNKICRFATIQEKKTIYRELLNAGETALALLVLLLCIYELIYYGGEDKKLLPLTKDIFAVLSCLKTLAKNNYSLSYITVTVREILVCVIAIEKGYNCNLFPARRKVIKLLNQLVLMLVNEFSRRCSPGSSLLHMFDACFQSRHSRRGVYYAISGVGCEPGPPKGKNSG